MADERRTPTTPASEAAEKAAQPDFQPQFAGKDTHQQPKGHPGGLITHVIDLAKALRDRQWATALGYFGEIVRLVQADLDLAPPAPMMSSAVLAASANQVAERLERFASDNGGYQAGAPGERGAIPWTELFFLLKMALDVILSKRT